MHQLRILPLVLPGTYDLKKTSLSCVKCLLLIHQQRVALNPIATNAQYHCSTISHSIKIRPTAQQSSSSSFLLPQEPWLLLLLTVPAANNDVLVRNEALFSVKLALPPIGWHLCVDMQSHAFLECQLTVGATGEVILCSRFLFLHLCKPQVGSGVILEVSPPWGRGGADIDILEGNLRERNLLRCCTESV